MSREVYTLCDLRQDNMVIEQNLDLRRLCVRADNASHIFNILQLQTMLLTRYWNKYYVCCSAYDCVIPARGKGIAKTDLSISIPSGTYARVAPRSGLAVKHFIDTGAGVVDEDYRGNVGVVLFNHGENDFQSKTLLLTLQTCLVQDLLSSEIIVSSMNFF